MRRSWLVLAGLLVAGFAVYSGLWFRAAGLVRDGLPAWAEARRAQGYDLAWTSAAVEGFPLAFRLHLGGASLATARPLPATAAAPDLVLEAAPWDLHDWRFSTPQGAQFSAPLNAVGVSAAALNGTVSARDGGATIAATARTLAGTGLAQGLAAGALDLQVSLPAHMPAQDTDPLVALSVKLDDATVPQAPAPLTPQIDTVALTATVKGPIVAGPLDQALAAWRDTGGTLEIDEARIAWGGTTLSLSGTLALDGAMQPEGALTATIDGGDQMIDRLVASGALKERFAGFAKSVMRAIATPSADGSKVRLPVTVQDQRVYVGPATIATLPHLTWR
jgi:hypothetical protein